MKDQTDRGAAIVAAAWVEEELQALLKDTLLDHATVAGHFLSRVSFEHRINLARLLGIVTAEIRADLHSIREVRNEFAHNISARDTSAEALSFKHPNIRNRCLSLNCVAFQRRKNPRDAFVLTCIELVHDFHTQRFHTPRIVEGTRTH